MQEYYVFKKEDIDDLINGRAIHIDRSERLPEYISNALIGVFKQEDLEALNRSVKLRRLNETTYHFL